MSALWDNEADGSADPAPAGSSIRPVLVLVVAIATLVNVMLFSLLFPDRPAQAPTDASGDVSATAATEVPGTTAAPTRVAPTTSERVTAPPSGAATGPPSADGTRAAVPPARFRVQAPAAAVSPFQTVPLRGRCPIKQGPVNLLVQWRERGSWETFPLRPRTDRDGHFTAYVELGRPGRYHLRVVNPSTGLASNVVRVTVNEQPAA